MLYINSGCFLQLNIALRDVPGYINSTVTQLRSVLSINRSLNQPINQSINQSVMRWKSSWICQGTGQCDNNTLCLPGSYLFHSRSLSSQPIILCHVIHQMITNLTFILASSPQTGQCDCRSTEHISDQLRGNRELHYSRHTASYYELHRRMWDCPVKGNI